MNQKAIIPKHFSFNTVNEYINWLCSHQEEIIPAGEIISYYINETEEKKVIIGNGKDCLSQLPQCTPFFAKNYKGVKLSDIRTDIV